MEEIEAEVFKPRVLRNGKVLGSVEWRKPQRKKRKTNSNVAESESIAASAPSENVVAALPIEPKPPIEELRNDGKQVLVAPQNVGTAEEATGKRSLRKSSMLSVELADGLKATKRPRTIRIKEEPVDPQPEGDAFAQKDTAEPLQSADQQLPAAIILDERNSNTMQVGKNPDTLPVGPGCCGKTKAARKSGSLQMIIKQERNVGVDDDPSCPTKQKHSISELRRVSKNIASPIDRTLKSNDKNVPLTRGRKPKHNDLPVASEAPTMANTLEILRPNAGTSQADDGGAAAMETQQQKELITSDVDVEQISTSSASYVDEGHEKSDAIGVEDSIVAEKVLVSIPIDQNILAAIIKQEPKDEGQESTTQQQCCSDSLHSIKQERLEQEIVLKSTASTVGRSKKKNDKKVPLKRDRNLNNKPVTSEAPTMANTLEVLRPNAGTSQADDGGAAAMETQQQRELITNDVDVERISTAPASYVDGGHEKSDALGEEDSTVAEKLVVSIPINPNILAAIIKQEPNDEGQESTTQQQFCSDSLRSIKQERLVQEKVSKSTALTVGRAKEKNDKKVPLKRDRKLKNQPVASKAATMANTLEILCAKPDTSQTDYGGTVTMETQQQKKFHSLTSDVEVEQISTASASYVEGGHENSDIVELEDSTVAEKLLVSIPIDQNILAAIIKQEPNIEGQESTAQQQFCSDSLHCIKQERFGQEIILKSTASTVGRAKKKNGKKVPLKWGRKLKNQPVTSKPATMANTLEILCAKPGTSQADAGGAAAMETQQQKELITSDVDVEQISTASASYVDGGHEKSDALGEEDSIVAEELLVSIPVDPNSATIIKQAPNDEGQESTTQQQCCYNSHPGRVSKSTASTVGRAKKKNDKKVPLKRGRKPKNLAVASEAPTVKEDNKSAATTMANTLEILLLNSGTSQADDGGSAIMETKQQPLYVSDSEELLDISDVTEIQPKDNTYARQASGVCSISDPTETDHSCYLELRKPFQRQLVREWFYSNLDQCLLGRGNGVQDMETLLSSQLPALTTRRLNRACWNHVRNILRRLSLVKPQRRCSEKFFLDERMLLEQRREKVRFLQAYSMFEYLDDDLPADLPVGIGVGDPVVVQLIEPYGVFRGVVENMNGSSSRSYTVRFEDPTIDSQIVPDINIASAAPASEPTQEAEVEEIMMVSKNLSKQLALLEDQLNDKGKLLNEMEYLRLRFRSIQHHSGTHQGQALMQAHQQRYRERIDDLKTINSSIALLLRTITRYGINVDEALIDRQMLQIGPHLQDICSKAGNIPLGNGVLELTLRELRGPPSHLKELQMFLQGNKSE